MDIILYEIPFVIYSRYKRMRRQGTCRSVSLSILSQLNNVSKDEMECVIDQETHKEKQLGFMAYMDTYREMLNQPDISKISYHIENVKKSK